MFMIFMEVCKFSKSLLDFQISWLESQEFGQEFVLVRYMYGQDIFINLATGKSNRFKQTDFSLHGIAK